MVRRPVAAERHRMRGGRSRLRNNVSPAPTRSVSINAAIAFALLLVTAVLASGSSVPPEAAAAREAESIARVSPEVRQTLDEHATARVLVTLREPQALRSLPLDVGRLRAEVAATQASVLASAKPGEFALAYRYLAVPALAGEVTSEGLAAIAFSIITSSSSWWTSGFCP